MKTSFSGEPVPAEIRPGLERFFGAGLSHVRLHTGDASGSLAAAVDARAFTFGSDIFFASPRPDFATRSGLRLLVHELAHACQQRSASRAGTAIRLGAPDDPQEAEAQAASAAFLAGRPAPVLTPDATVILRRDVTIDRGTAKIKVHPEGAVPTISRDVALGGDDIVVCHLTKGFKNAMETDSAFTADGEVKATGPLSERLMWKIRFIQFLRLKDLTFTYSGGAATDERIVISPEVRINPSLDSRDDFTPFTNADRQVIKGDIATNVMGDHPSSRMPISLPHRTSGRTNMITSITDNREFWTAFVARSPGGAIQYLAHFHWELLYRFTLEWELTEVAGMQLRRKFNSSSIKFDTPVLGPPAVPELSALLANPQGRQANDVLRDATLDALSGGPPGRVDFGF